MKKRTIFVLLALAIWAAGCTDSVDSYRERRFPSPYGAAAAPSGTVNADEASVPDIELDQEVVNCSNSQYCHLEEIQGNDQDRYSIRSLIVADTNVMASANVSASPAISFQITGIAPSLISSVSYSYSKKDTLGNTIIQTGFLPIYENSGSYLLPINAGTLGSGILVSAPYEKHVFRVKITVSDNSVHTRDINFHVSSQMQSPILIERKSSINDSSYYKMDSDDPIFTVDSVSLKNVLPYPITTKGSIVIRNSTVAFLSRQQKVQHTQLLPGYDYNIYYDDFTRHEWSIGSSSAYRISVAAPIYKVRVKKGINTYEEIPVEIEAQEDHDIISFNGLVLLGDEELQLDVMIQPDANTGILGQHGSRTFYEGISTCGVINEPKKCNCFYTPVPQVYTMGLVGSINHAFCVAYLETLSGMDHPECSISMNPSLMAESLFMSTLPEENITLAGRHHKTEASYSVSSWLKDYEELDPLGSTTRTMDTLEASKGYVDYVSVNINEAYQGYIPGTL